MGAVLAIVLVVVVVYFLLKTGIIDTIGKCLIPVFRKKQTDVKKTIKDINVQAAKSDIRIQFVQAQNVLSTIKKLRYDTGKSIEDNRAKINNLELALSTATNDQVPTRENLLKRKEDAKILVSILEKQRLYLSQQEEKLRTIIEKLNIDGLLTNLDLDNLANDISQSVEYLENIGNQFPK